MTPFLTILHFSWRSGLRCGPECHTEEARYDILEVNGIAFSGDIGPENVVPSGIITWNSAAGTQVDEYLLTPQLLLHLVLVTRCGGCRSLVKELHLTSLKLLLLGLGLACSTGQFLRKVRILGLNLDDSVLDRIFHMPS